MNFANHEIFRLKMTALDECENIQTMDEKR